MCARSTDPVANRRQRGFTMVELILVMVMLGILAVTMLPRMDVAASMGSVAWREQVLSALREAHSLAQAHRRLVCVSVGGSAVTLTIADQFGATACNQPWLGPDRDSRYAYTTNAPATSVSPAGTLYFQPSGRVTSDGAGTTSLNASIAVAGESAIAVVGETGSLQ
ncbi:MAG: type II secretion system protein [Ideonella sp.]|nr:type II secretion system protein [Ideonella sp.]